MFGQRVLQASDSDTMRQLSRSEEERFMNRSFLCTTISLCEETNGSFCQSRVCTAKKRSLSRNICIHRDALHHQKLSQVKKQTLVFIYSIEIIVTRKPVNCTKIHFGNCLIALQAVNRSFYHAKLSPRNDPRQFQHKLLELFSSGFIGLLHLKGRRG